MKVKFLVSVSSSEWGSPEIGETVDIPDNDAKRFIEKGLAEQVKTVRKKSVKQED